MAAFALGLVGDPSAHARSLLLLPTRILWWEATPPRRWACWVRADATAVSDMVLRHAWAGALASIGSDDLAYPLAPPVEAARLGYTRSSGLGHEGAGCGGSRCFRSARFDMVAGPLCVATARRYAPRLRSSRSSTHRAAIHLPLPHGGSAS